MMQARAQGGFWGSELLLRSYGQKNLNYRRTLGYKIQKNCINYSSISENLVFDDFKIRFFSKFLLSLRSGTCIFLTRYQILKFFNIEN